ncbi:polysaccharide deacetylase family protein [Chloroflexia bacterium SDU3-3]|nr:polysaccharide deacetylase family protein [Chloroflexia bacterium SDU3-3]
MGLQPKQLAIQAIDKLGTLVLSPPVGGFGYFHNHGPRDQRKVAITFDDGPSMPCTEELLDVMGELDVKGTFFCVGVNTRWHPQIVRRAYEEGHIIANHSYEHSRKAGLRLGSNGDHIDRGAALISQAIGCAPRLYRPPWGWMTPWEGQRLTQRGYTVVGWDVYTLDWQWPENDGRMMAEDARSKVQPGSIILWHDANAGVRVWEKKETARAIKHLVPMLRSDGYQIVTAAELLGVPAYGPALSPA